MKERSFRLTLKRVIVLSIVKQLKLCFGGEVTYVLRQQFPCLDNDGTRPYVILKRMWQDGLVEVVNIGLFEKGHPVSQFYQITDRGRQTLAQASRELTSLALLLSNSQTD